jgi:hypothetical protein
VILAPGRSFASHNAQTAYLASYNTSFTEKIYIGGCCIDLLRPPHLPSMWIISEKPTYHDRVFQQLEELKLIPKSVNGNQPLRNERVCLEFHVL